MSERIRLRRSNFRFLCGLGVLGSSYLFLIVAVLISDLFATTPDHLLHALQSPEIRYAIKLSLVSCCITTILALWVAVPLGYLLARTQFPGKKIMDTLIDIPMVLPPMVIGLSLLILLQSPPGQTIEKIVAQQTGWILTYGLIGFVAFGLVVALGRRWPTPLSGKYKAFTFLAMVLAVILGTDWPTILEPPLTKRFATHITYGVPAVILAQFAVCTAFVVRTMRVTFEQISPRSEQLAWTLGCSRSQAFWRVALPEAWRGVLTAGTLCWARALGEFGPILILASTTRMRTEVLTSTVYLELGYGNLNGAIAVSLVMIAAAIMVLGITRSFGSRNVL